MSGPEPYMVKAAGIVVHERARPGGWWWAWEVFRYFYDRFTPETQTQLFVSPARTPNPMQCYVRGRHILVAQKIYPVHMENEKPP